MFCEGGARVRSRLPVCLLGSPPPQHPPPCLLLRRPAVGEAAAAKARGRGQHGMRPGGSGSTLFLGCHLLKACFSNNNRCKSRDCKKKDNGQGAVHQQPKRLGPGVTNHCCPQISRMDRTESDEAGLSANPCANHVIIPENWTNYRSNEVDPWADD